MENNPTAINLSSVQNRMISLRLKPAVIGMKYLFRERILRKISKEEFKIKRNSSI